MSDKVITDAEEDLVTKLKDFGNPEIVKLFQESLQHLSRGPVRQHNPSYWTEDRVGDLALQDALRLTAAHRPEGFNMSLGLLDGAQRGAALIGMSVAANLLAGRYNPETGEFLNADLDLDQVFTFPNVGAAMTPDAVQAIETSGAREAVAFAKMLDISPSELEGKTVRDALEMTGGKIPESLVTDTHKDLADAIAHMAQFYEDLKPSEVNKYGINMGDRVVGDETAEALVRILPSVGAGVGGMLSGFVASAAASGSVEAYFAYGEYFLDALKKQDIDVTDSDKILQAFENKPEAIAEAINYAQIKSVESGLVTASFFGGTVFAAAKFGQAAGVGTNAAIGGSITANNMDAGLNTVTGGTVASANFVFGLIVRAQNRGEETHLSRAMNDALKKLGFEEMTSEILADSHEAARAPDSLAAVGLDNEILKALSFGVISSKILVDYHGAVKAPDGLVTFGPDGEQKAPEDQPEAYEKGALTSEQAAALNGGFWSQF